MEVHKLTIQEAKNLLRKKEISSLELTTAAINQISKVESDLKAFVTLDTTSALEQAYKIDNLIASGKSLSDLTGIPMGVTDNICTMGIRTTCCSNMLNNFIPPYDATVIKKIKQQGSILIGKTNMDEFAMGSSNENSCFHNTCNPWDLTRVPGGSSGGSAAAVSSSEVLFALGSDTGGCIRQPASFCGVVGMKPTYGTVSRFGLIASASSFDQIGPITKNVTDCALVLNAITGYDEADSTSINRTYPDYRKALIDNIRNLKVGVPKEYFGQGIKTEVKNSIENAMKIFEDLGAKVEYISLPHTEYALATYYIIASAEASSNLAKYDGIKYGYRSKNIEELMDLYQKSRSEGLGTEVKRRIILGNYVLSSGCYDAYYKKALKVKNLIIKDFNNAFASNDIVLSPTNPTTAFRLGEKLTDPMEMYMSDVYTVPVNIAGLPAISIPCGFDSNGLPIGLQLISRHFNESIILQAAYTFEQNTDFHMKQPAIMWR